MGVENLKQHNKSWLPYYINFCNRLQDRNWVDSFFVYRKLQSKEKND